MPRDSMPWFEVGALDDRDRHLAALTGLRAVAATWVLLVHLDNEVSSLVAVPDWLKPLFTTGFLGVDLFFALSGFVIAHRYLGHIPTLRSAGDFWWLRLARIYPVHVLMMVVAGVLIYATTQSGRSGPGGTIGLASGVENALLVHGWFNQPLSWNEPAWTISLEWLAYLLFPALAVPLVAAQRRIPGLVVGTTLFTLAYAPLVLQGLGVLKLDDFGGGALGISLLRIIGGFVGGCGAFVCARAVERGLARSGRPSASG